MLVKKLPFPMLKLTVATIRLSVGKEHSPIHIYASWALSEKEDDIVKIVLFEGIVCKDF